MKKSHISLFLLLCVGFLYSCHPLSLYGEEEIVPNGYFTLKSGSGDQKCKSKRHRCRSSTLTYYLYIADFAESFIEIPTSNVSVDSSTIASQYLAGRAALYDACNRKVGTCSASFLSMQNADGIYTDISNFLSVDNGLIVTWFTPTKLINLELDSIIHSMVTECIVEASTKVGVNPFFGKSFNLIVSSDNEKIYFQFSKR